jgi:hypothetical protein
MAKIKNWDFQGEDKVNGEVVRLSWDNTEKRGVGVDIQKETLRNKGTQWKFTVFKGLNRTNERTFETKKRARKFAVKWMRNHPNPSTSTRR